LPSCLVALGTREVEDDLLGLVGHFLFGDDVGMQQLVGDIGENGGAAGRDAAFGHQDEEPSEVFAKVFGRGEVSAVGEEICREVGGVIGSARKDDRGVAQTEMMRAEARLGWQSGLAALLAVGIAMLAAEADRGGNGYLSGVLRVGCFGLQDFYVWGLCGHDLPFFLAGEWVHPGQFVWLSKQRGYKI